MQVKFIFLLLLPSAVSLADVNMKDASYIHSASEIGPPIFRKTYNSRSLFIGTFGFGWCAEFERTLSPIDGVRRHCGQTSRPVARKKSDSWDLILSDGSLEIYDFQGRLKALKSPGSPPAILSYRNDSKLESISVRGEKFIFTYDSKTGAIQSINSSRKSVAYAFSGRDLAGFKASGKEAVSFRYDGFHNLVEARTASGKFEKIKYADRTDEIKSIQASNGCSEEFKFEKRSDTELRASAQRTCPFAVPQIKYFLFIARKAPQGSLALKQVKLAGGQNETSALP